MSEQYWAVPADEATTIKATRTKGRRGITATYKAAEAAMNAPGEMFYVPEVSAIEFGNAYRRVRQQGMQLHTAKAERDGIPGCYVWVDFIEG